MDINQWLEFIDQFKDIAVVRFFARFYSESFLSPYLKAVQNAVLSDSPKETGIRLLIFAAVLFLLVFVVDQVLYYTQPGTSARLKGSLARGLRICTAPLAGNKRSVPHKGKKRTARRK